MAVVFVVGICLALWGLSVEAQGSGGKDWGQATVEENVYGSVPERACQVSGIGSRISMLAVLITALLLIGVVSDRGKCRVLTLLLIISVFLAGVLRTVELAGSRQEILEQLSDGEMVTASGTIVRKEQKKDQLICELEEVILLPKQKRTILNSGAVRVSLPASEIYPIGTILFLSGQLHYFHEATNEGEFDQRQFYQSQGIWFQFYEPEVIRASAQDESGQEGQGKHPEVEEVSRTVPQKHPEVEEVSRTVEETQPEVDSVRILEEELDSRSVQSWTGCLWLRFRDMDFQLQEWLYGIRVHLTGVMEELMVEENAGVLAGMLMGDRNRIDAETKLAYRNAGISHLYAISALHISIFAMSLYRLLRGRGVSFWHAAVCSIGMIRLYALMTGNSLSTRRSVAMFAIMTIGMAAGRSYDLLNALGFWVVLSLWENPFLLEYSGFVFSVTAVMGIGVTVRILQMEERKTSPGSNPGTRVRIRGLRWKQAEGAERQAGKRAADKPGNRVRGMQAEEIKKGLQKSMIAGIGLQLTTMPVVACYYYEIPTYAVFLNLLLIPAMTLVLVSGAAGVCAGSFWLPIGKLLIFPADLLLSVYRRLCDLSLALPCSQIVVGKPGLLKLILYYGGLGTILYGIYRRKLRMQSVEENPLLLIQKLAAVAGLLGLVLFLYHPPALQEEVDILDVGQGLGIYFAVEDGHTFFIDGGSTNKSQVGTYQILPFLKSKGIRRIDFWCISHADQDHMNGAIEVFEAGYPVDRLILAEAMPKDEAYRSLVQAAKSNGTEILTMRAGDSLVMGEEKLECLFPPSGETLSAAQDAEPLSGEPLSAAQGTEPLPGETLSAAQGADQEDGKNTADRNKLCLTLLLRTSAYTCLFPGDLSAEEERILLEEGNLPEVDLYVAAHHGSRYSNSRAFLEALCPKTAVVSCSRTNRYGHPGAEAVENMEAAGAKIYYTMESGQLSYTGSR